MKRVRFLSFFLPMMILCSFGCSHNVDEPKENEDETNRPPVAKAIPINISMGAFSRVTDTNYENNDKIGLYVVNYVGGNPGSLVSTGNHVDNVGFTYKNGKWTPDYEVFWKDNTTKADFYSYYPFMKIENVESVSIGVQTDQSTIESYKSSEFLWGKAYGIVPTSSAVNIVTNRVVSCMVVDVKPGEGYTEEELASTDVDVRICNVQTSASLNLKNGITTPLGKLSTIVPYKIDGTYKALLVPQVINGEDKLVSITVNGVEYTYAKQMEFKPNKKHTFTITINKVNGSIDIGIGGWEEDEEDYGGSAE